MSSPLPWHQFPEQVDLAKKKDIKKKRFCSSWSINVILWALKQADSSCTSHSISGPLKGTTKRGTCGKHSSESKKNNKRKANKIIALRCKLEGLKAEKSDTQQARGCVEILIDSAEGKTKEYREKFHTLCVKKKVVERDLLANFVKQAFCKSLSLLLLNLLSPHQSIRNDRRRTIMKHILQHNLLAKNLQTTCIRIHKSKRDAQIEAILSLHWILYAGGTHISACLSNGS